MIQVLSCISINDEWKRMLTQRVYFSIAIGTGAWKRIKQKITLDKCTLKIYFLNGIFAKYDLNVK